MEIEKGFCNFCSADRVLCGVKRRKFQKLLESLFNRHINAQFLEDVFGSFGICPLCHEKFILLDKRYKAIKSHKKGSDYDNCILCGDEDGLYKIKKWPHFDTLSEDFDFDSGTILICPACLVYLDIRNTIKQQLLQQSREANRSAKSTYWELQNYEGEKHQKTPPNIKRGIKSLKQQKKILPKALISDYKLYSSIMYVRLTNCVFGDTGSTYRKFEDRSQHSRKAQLQSSYKNFFKEKSHFQSDSSNKNMEFQIVSCSNTRRSAFKIKFKSLMCNTDSPPVPRQSKLQSASKIKKTFQNGKLSSKAIKKLLKEHHMLKELSVQISREDLEKKQECSLYNSNTIIICDSDNDDETDGLIKNAINKILDEADPLDILECHDDGEKGIEGIRTRKSNARRSRINEYGGGTSNSIYYEEEANSRKKRTRKQKTPSKRTKLDINKEGSDPDENDTNATTKQKSEELKNQTAIDRPESDSEEKEIDDENNGRAEATNLKQQSDRDENMSDGEKKENKSKDDDIMGEKEGETILDGSDKDTRGQSKPKKQVYTESANESSINETGVEPNKNTDVSENNTESDVIEIDKAENIQQVSGESLQSGEELEGQADSKEDKIGGKTDDTDKEQSHAKDQTEANTENIVESEPSASEENKQKDASLMEDSSIECGGTCEAGKISTEEQEAQLEASKDQNEQENGAHDLGDKSNDSETVIGDKTALENDMSSIQDNEVVQNKEINALEDAESDLGQNKEYEEQKKQENEDHASEERENDATSLHAPSCEIYEDRECDNTDNEGDKLEGIKDTVEKEGQDAEENTKKRKSFDEISNVPKKLKVDDVKISVDDDDDEVEKKLAKVLSQSPTRSHQGVIISDLEDNYSEASGHKKDNTNSNENIECMLKQNADDSEGKGIDNNGHIDDVNGTLNNAIVEEQLSGTVEEEKCEDLSNSSICSNGTEKRKKKVTFNDESNVTFE
nr:unnamed protein product [Callosobruchus chinensis]